MVKNTTKFQVLRVLYNLHLDNYSVNKRYKVVTM